MLDKLIMNFLIHFSYEFHISVLSSLLNTGLKCILNTTNLFPISKCWLLPSQPMFSWFLYKVRFPVPSIAPVKSLVLFFKFPLSLQETASVSDDKMGMKVDFQRRQPETKDFDANVLTLCLLSAPVSCLFKLNPCLEILNEMSWRSRRRTKKFSICLSQVT